MGIPFPPSELALIDLTVRMFTQPELQGDLTLLGKVWTDERDRKDALLAALGITADDLQSAERFARCLRDYGVEPVTKPGKNGAIYAFARTDDFMRELLEDGDDDVRTLAEARLAIKSTLDQRRAERLGFMARRGPMCVYLNYAGTHTTLWSGGDGVNYQNFKRGSNLRKALKAPAGYLIAKVDQSQVQCRIVNWLGKQEDVLDKFRRGEDPYIGIASQFYGRAITKSDVAERGTGKQLELSCGFGSGADTIRKTAKKGTYGPAVELSAEQSLSARNLYRVTHPGVVNLWTQGDAALAQMVYGDSFKLFGYDFLPVQGTTLTLPNGAPMHWAELRWDVLGRSFEFLHKKNWWKKIWGGFLVQNIVSGLASVLVRQAMLRIRTLGLRIVLQEHDAVGVLVLDDGNAENTLQLLIDEMRKPPDWGPDLPLDAEGSLAETYQ